MSVLTPRLGYVGDDATSFVEQSVFASTPQTPAQQTALARRRDIAHATGDHAGESAACWELAWGSIRLGSWVARSYYPAGMERGDLIMASLTGLYRAAQLWDPCLARFSTYATHWARQAVQRCLAEHSRVIRVPAHAHEMWLRERGSDDVEQPRAVADFAGRASAWPAHLDALQAHAERWTCLLDEDATTTADRQAEWPVPLGSARTFLNLCIDDLAPRFESSEFVEELLAELPPRTQDILRRRFGFVKEPQTLEEIGRIHNLTRERIRQIEEKALKDLRERLDAADTEKAQSRLAAAQPRRATFVMEPPPAYATAAAI